MVNHYFCVGMSAGVEIKKQPGAGTKEKNFRNATGLLPPFVAGARLERTTSRL